MRILQTAVSAVGFRKPRYTNTKTELLHTLASLAAERSCGVLHLPAGFVRATDLTEADAFIRTIAQIGRRHGIAIVGGVDLPGAERRRKKKRNRGAVKGRHPFLGFATEPSGRCHGLLGRWRQVSTTSDDALYAPPLDVAERVIRVDGVRFAVLVCGEMHNRRIREALHTLGIRAVLVSGHCGLGQGLVPTLRAISSVARVPAVHAQHLIGKSGKLHFVGSRGSSVPKPVANRMVAGEPVWAAATVRTV